MQRQIPIAARFLAALGVSIFAAAAQAAIEVSPRQVQLDSPEASQQLLVSTIVDEGRRVDLSRDAKYQVVDAALATVSDEGLVRPLDEGRTEIVVRHSQGEVRVPLEIVGQKQPAPVSFRHEIIPILTKARCNSGGCHGKAEGQNGFKLSIFGFDTAADYDALTKESRGRRISLAAPAQSLLLQKGAAETPHGGGQKLERGSYRFLRLCRWIAEGARATVENDSPLQGIEIEPQQQVLLSGGSQQLRVTAIDSAGVRRCVTVEAEYESNAATLAEVSDRGLIQASDIPGEAAILVRYLGHVAICRVTMPRPGVKFPRPAEANLVDKHVWDKLALLGIEPSRPADDATFLRRVYLDTIGMLPTPAEARAFLADRTPDRRARLIDQLLTRDEYADYWAMHWSTILRNDQLKVTPQGAYAMHRWLRQQFVENRPFDQFVQEIVTVRGNTRAESPAAFFKALAKPEEMSRSVSQLFLGVRIECAQCHHHPSEKWGQDDYAGLAGFFTGVAIKKLPGGGEAVVARAGADLKHPRTGELVPARALGAEPADFSQSSDRREQLAQWMTSPDNRFLAPTLVNRIWAHYFGRGLVEPVDDLRETNPATNEPLLKALVEHFKASQFDLRALTRTLLNSNVYQLSSQTISSNASDLQNFSHAAFKTLPAEVLLDAVCQSTGVPEKFNGWPIGYRAVQVWDNRMPSYFFRIFGRPVRATVCECERSDEPSISQALHLLNSPEISEKIGDRHGLARQLAESQKSAAEIIDELYLGTLSRMPTETERAFMLSAFVDDANRQATEDVLWTLLNTKEYLYNH